MTMNTYEHTSQIVLLEESVEHTKGSLISVQSVPITTNVASSITARDEVSSNYAIKFVSDIRQVGRFFRVLLFRPSPRYN